MEAAGRRGWSVISSALLSNEGLANHWAMYRRGCEAGGRIADGANWRVCRSIVVAGTDEEARARAFGAESGHRHFFGHMHKVYTQLGRLAVLDAPRISAWFIGRYIALAIASFVIGC